MNLCYNSNSFLCRPLQNNDVKMSEQREPQRLTFYIFISNLSLSPLFSFVIVSREENKKSLFDRSCPRCRGYLNSLILIFPYNAPKKLKKKNSRINNL